jgi:hypothetical protein
MTVTGLYKKAGIDFDNHLKKTARKEVERTAEILKGTDYDQEKDYEEKIRIQETVRHEKGCERWESFCKWAGCEAESAADKAATMLWELRKAEAILIKYRYLVLPDSVVIRKMEDFVPGQLYVMPGFQKGSEIPDARTFQFQRFDYDEEIEGWVGVFQREHDGEVHRYSRKICQFFLEKGKAEADYIIEEIGYLKKAFGELPQLCPVVLDWNDWWLEKADNISCRIKDVESLLRFWEDVRPRLHPPA